MIKLDDNYRIEEDAHNWTLIYEAEGDVNPNTGKRTVSRDASYHANLGQALTVYLDKNLKGSTDILDVKNRLLEVEQRLAKIK